MLNRAVLILKYKPEAVDWINNAVPSDDMEITPEEANSERTAYLIDEDEAENLDKMLKKKFLVYFEKELGGWYADETLWPAGLTYDLFCQWFTVECYSVVEDCGEYEIYDDEDD